MDFDAASYGPEVARILSHGDGGTRLMPLAISGCTSEEAREALKSARARTLFPDAYAPEAALSGLWLYFGCFEESHGISQDIATAEGSYWHGILHRQEPDPGNAGYWFRRVGAHPIFPELLREASGAGWRGGSKWDPLEFIDFCESARRRPGSQEEETAQQIQLIEWQLLFDYCARKRTPTRPASQ